LTSRKEGELEELHRTVLKKSIVDQILLSKGNIFDCKRHKKNL